MSTRLVPVEGEHVTWKYIGVFMHHETFETGWQPIRLYYDDLYGRWGLDRWDRFDIVPRTWRLV